MVSIELLHAALKHDDPRVRRTAISLVPRPVEDDRIIAFLFDSLEGANPDLLTKYAAARILLEVDLDAPQLQRLLRLPFWLEDDQEFSWLGIDDLPIDTLRRHRESLLHDPLVPQNARGAIHDILQAAALPDEVIWQRLLTTDREIEDIDLGDRSDETSLRYAELRQLSKRLLRVAAKRPELRRRAVSILNAAVERGGEVSDLHTAIDLLSIHTETAAATALLTLVHLFNFDEHAGLLDSIYEALNKVRTPDVLDEMERIFSDRDFVHMQTLADVISNIGGDAAEATLLRLYDRAGTDKERALIAGSMAQMAASSDRAREVMLEAAFLNADELSDDDVAEEVVILGRILGWSGERFHALCLKVGSDIDRRALRRQRRGMDAGGWSQVSQIAELLDSYFQGPTLDSEKEFAGSKYDITMPIIRNEPKVGRNDPCPCGSGKKYKKCCYRE